MRKPVRYDEKLYKLYRKTKKHEEEKTILHCKKSVVQKRDIFCEINNHLFIAC